MNNLDKKYFIISFVFHIAILLLLILFNTDNKIHRHFLVLGAHSKKPTQAYFKPLKPHTTTDWIRERNKTLNTKSQGKSQKKQTPKEKTKKTIKPKKKESPKATTKKEPKIKKLKEANPKQTKKEQKVKTPKEEIKKEAKKEKIEPEITKTLPKKQQVNNEENDELHFNLLGESDPNLAIYQKQIQKEVQRLWRPPIGVPKGTLCSASFLIDSKGKVEKFEFINRSKILIYDLSVSRITKNFNIEKSLWNKKIIIDFRQ